LQTEPQSDAAHDLPEEFGELLAELAELAAEADDLAMQDTLASMLASFDDPDPPREAMELLVAALIEAIGPRAVLLLDGVARLAGEPLAAVAAAAVAERGGCPPGTVGVASLELVAASMVRAEEIEIYALLLGRPGHPDRQPAVLGIERGATGAVVYASLGGPDDAPPDGDPLSALDQTMFSRRGARAIEPAVLAKRLRTALVRAREDEVELDGQAVADLVLIARAVTGVGGLARGLLVGEELDDAAEEWVDPVLAGPPPAAGRDVDPAAGDPQLVFDMERDGEHERFSAAQERILVELEEWVCAAVPRGPIWEQVDFVSSTMLDWKVGYGDGEVARWTARDLAEYLLGHFPRKVTIGDEDLEVVVDCVLTFLRFLEWRGSLRGDLFVALSRAAKGLRDEFLERARDSTAWGPAKSMAQRMLAAGVDPADEGAVARWMAAFNVLPAARREDVLGGLGAPAGAPGDRPSRPGATQRRPSDAQRRDKRRAEKQARKRGRR